jgi:hypothetical protein
MARIDFVDTITERCSNSNNISVRRKAYGTVKLLVRLYSINIIAPFYPSVILPFKDSYMTRIAAPSSCCLAKGWRLEIFGLRNPLTKKE